MIPLAYDKPIRTEEWHEEWHKPESWNDAEERVVARDRDIERRVQFIDWCAQQPLIWYDDLSADSTDFKLSRLVEMWRDETENVSSITRIISNPAYQRIIDMGIELGKPVITFILKDFERNRGYWATALHTITGENPVAVEHMGNPNMVRGDWLKWGRSHGYL